MPDQPFTDLGDKMKKLGAILLALVAILGGAYYYLFLYVAPLDRSLYSFDLDEVRSLATASGEALPLAVNTEAPITVAMPGAAVITGRGWAENPMPIYTFQVQYADSYLMVDAAMSQAQGSVMGGDLPFDQEVYDRLMDKLSGATQIVFTHEHVDHIGGVIAHPDAVGLLDRVRFTQEQLDSPEYWGGLFYPDGALDGYEGLDYDRYLAIAPGVVLIEAAGHTPGSQIVYVQTQDGREYLLIGDVAWHADGYRTVTPRPELVSQFFLGEDRARHHAQLATLKELEDTNDNLHIVTGHDPTQVQGYIESGALGARFQ